MWNSGRKIDDDMLDLVEPGVVDEAAGDHFGAGDSLDLNVELVANNARVAAKVAVRVAAAEAAVVGAKGNRAIARADAERVAASSSRTSSPSIALPRS